MSKAAAFAAFGVAMFPCKCAGQQEIVPGVHYVSAAVMFGILAAFCYSFFRRARSKGWAQARTRALVYALCGIVILAVMAAMAVDILTGDGLSDRIDRFTFYAEAAGLIAFGIAWLVASRILPLITRPDERLPFSPFAARSQQKTTQT